MAGSTGNRSSRYLTPGVYVEDVPSGNRPIEGVGTSVAAFVGLAPFSARRAGVTVLVVAIIAALARRLVR